MLLINVPTHKPKANVNKLTEHEQKKRRFASAWSEYDAIMCINEFAVKILKGS